MKTATLHKLLFSKIVVCCLLLFSIAGRAHAQSEPNNPITYDTTITESANGEGPITWQVRITRQLNDNTPRPAFFSMPGAGEVGTDPANLIKFGPHYWLLNGWDGGVKLENGTHYPIIVTIEQPANNMRPWHLKAVVQTLLKVLPIKKNSVHLCGLSQGSYEWGELIAYAASAGDESAMSMIRSWVDLEGVGPGDNFSGFNQPYPTVYGIWAQKYGGRFFGLEGTQDSRNIWQISQAMNAVVPNSAYFSYENIGGGAHCCWNSMYDPSVTNWQNIAPVTNPNIAPSTNPASTMGNYFVDPVTGTNIFQWMLRQGDTTMVAGSGGTSAPPTVNAGSAQTIQLPTSTVTLTGTATAASGHTIKTTNWVQTSGPSTATISSASALSTSVSGLIAGTYVFTLTATDDASQSASATVTITVQASATQPPTVNAGSSQVITLPLSTVTLTGTATGNGGATISSTAWSLTSGPNVPTIVSAGSLVTVITGLVQGSYVFTLTATDNNNATSTSTVTITVNASTPVTTGPKIIVGTGEYQVFFLDQNKKLYGIGTNIRTLGVAGNGIAGTTLPLAVPSNLTFQTVAAGLHGGAAIDVNGNVWAWGDNSVGQTGGGTTSTTEVMTPAQIMTDASGNPFTGVAALCAFFSGNVSDGWYAIKSDGSLWVWGQTLGGMRGDGTTGVTAQTRPVQVPVPGNRKVAQVSAGNILIVLCTDGTVWTCGGTNTNPQNLGYAVSGNSYLSLQQLTTLSNITQISGGGGFNYALRADGTLFGWGYYGYYMGGSGGTNTPLATPTDLTSRLNLPHPVKQIRSNMVCTHAILTDGTLWGWGDNAQGTIGNGQQLDFSKTSAPYAWNFLPAQLLQQSPVQITTRNDFVALFETQPFVMYSYAETADGQLYSWGRNKTAVLGNGVIGCNPDVVATYPNSWDVPLATPVNPLAVTATVVVPSPYCLANPGTSPCSECSTGITPIANAGAASTITLPVNTATLDGSASTNPGGGTLTYAWQQIAGPTQYSITSANNATTTVTGLVQGVYTFQLTVTNAQGNKSTATVTVTVNPPAATTPVANAGANQTITLPTNSVNLDGSASSSPDGSALTYNWSLVSGPSQYSITSATGATTAVTNLVQGVYTFKLLVTNSSNNTASATVTITVNPVPVVLPIANAGSNQTITLPANSVNLDGSASSSPDGSALTYSWSLLSGPSQYTITSPQAAKTSVTGLAQGSYVFQLSVTNGQNNTASATVTITVNPTAVIVPVANAGSNQTITLPANSVSLDGSASSSPDGSALTYSWTLLSGPSQYTITSPQAAKTTVTGLTQGTYAFQLTVTNGQNNSASATVTVKVNPMPVIIPVASAGSNQTITLPTNSVTLDGSASSSPDGSALTYSWAWVSGPTQYTITSASAATTTVTGLVQGTYQFKLTVTNGQGNSASATVTITVNPAPIIVPVANAGGDQTITLPTNSVTLDGSASSSPDGSSLTYAWGYVSGPSQYTITSASTAKTTVTGLVKGVYQFRLTVTNGQGQSASDVVAITVNDPVVVPVANAGSNQTITLPANSVTLDGSASSSSDGSLLTYSWGYVSGPSQYTITSATAAKTTVTGLVQGIYKFRLTVTNSQGNTGTATVTVTVNPAPVIIPVASAGSNQTITLPTNTVTLDGSASSSSDGSALTYSWSRISGPTQYTITSAGSATTTVTGLVQGVYQFSLTVTNSQGNSAAATVTITVNPAPVIIPVANAGSNQTITLPVNSVTLDGSASSSPDGSSLTYHWARVSGPTQYAITGAGSATTTVTGLVQGVYQFSLTVTNSQGNSATATVTITVNPAPLVYPTANAGTNQTITLPTNSVNLDASSSSNPTGGTLTYYWKELSGPAQYTIGTQTAAKTPVTGLVAGTYQFQVTVTNSDGNTASAVVTVTVNPAPVVYPTANAGADQAITLPVNSVNLDGSASSNPTGGTLTYSWKVASGPSQYTITSSSVAKTGVTGLVQGVYLFQLTVTNSDGNTATSTVKVTVNPAPVIIPVANAGADQAITLPVNSVNLDGSASYNPGGGTLTYIWKELSGPAQYTIGGPTVAKTSVTGLVQGTYQFQLTVTNNQNNSATDVVTIQVMAANIPPVANAGSDATLTLPTSSLKLNGAGSYDPDGYIASYSWSELSGPPVAMTITGITTATPSVYGLTTAGVYVFQLTVTDNKGASATSKVTITVTGGSQPPPSFLVANAGADTTMALPASTLTLNGSASSALGSTITNYQWSLVSGDNGVALQSPSSVICPVANLQAGPYVFQLTVKDNMGNTATATRKVTVINPTRPSHSEDLFLYPNPARDQMHVRLTGDPAGKVRVNIYNISGARVMSLELVKDQSYLDQVISVSTLASGAYIMEVIIGDNHLMAKFVKQQ